MSQFYSFHLRPVSANGFSLRNPVLLACKRRFQAGA